MHLLEMVKSRRGSFMSCGGEVKAKVATNFPNISPYGLVLLSTI